MTSTLHVPRGGKGEVEFQFTIPFISIHNILGDLDDQESLYINMAVHGGSRECDDLHKNLCEVKVNAYKKQESYKYNTTDWRAIHKVKVYNRDDGDFTLKDTHITLRFEAITATDGGGKIFDGLKLPDTQVFCQRIDYFWSICPEMCATTQIKIKKPCKVIHFCLVSIH